MVSSVRYKALLEQNHKVSVLIGSEPKVTLYIRTARQRTSHQNHPFRLSRVSRSHFSFSEQEVGLRLRSIKVTLFHIDGQPLGGFQEACTGASNGFSKNLMQILEPLLPPHMGRDFERPPCLWWIL